MKVTAGLAAVIILMAAAALAAAPIVVIDESFENDDVAGSAPVNGCCPGTWLPNYFMTNDVDGGHSGPDTDLQAEVQNSGGNLVAQYVHGRGGGPEYDLDGYLKADEAAFTPGQTVSGSFSIRMVYGEGLVGLANNTEALADGTDNADPNYDWLPSPTSAMLFGLWLGAGYGASGGPATMYSSYANDRSLIGLSTNMGVNMAVAPTSVGWLRFDFQYTVGEAFLDSLTITSLDDGGATYDNAALVRLDTGGPVPVTTPGGFDGWFQGNGDKPDGAIRLTNFVTDDIQISTVPVEVPVQPVVVEDVVALEFESVAGLTYHLQSTPDPASTGFDDVGATLLGNGDIMNMFDATESPSKVYRMLVDEVAIP